jgi:hypothetical protein
MSAIEVLFMSEAITSSMKTVVAIACPD